ncbi:hypothetical protein M5K25_014844 [Dendrobium thyrsiflorum]|uniref:Uncharacterized protein n=1 Tax=Dendrobium thyrsiflorum TaxID=117978 RepID=A0ABD0UPJ3_DENTH
MILDLYRRSGDLHLIRESEKGKKSMSFIPADRESAILSCQVKQNLSPKSFFTMRICNLILP